MSEDETEGRVWLEDYGDFEELHIAFDDERVAYKTCKKLFKFFKALGIKVESDGFCVVVRRMKKK